MAEAEEIMSTETTSDVFAEHGEFLPLSVWATRGFAADLIEERSHPTGSDFGGLSTAGFQASNAVESASAMALHMSGGYAASETPSELNQGKFGSGAGEP